MKFGQTWNPDAEEETTTGSSDYLRYFKGAETTFRLLQEPNEWIDYWEHFNPNGYPFPCTRDRKTCPGCTSNNDKMKKASKKIAVQVLEGEWVNAYKLPKTVADKLANRANRIGTVTDRDYTVFKLQTKNADGSTKTDYDVEGGDKIPVDIAALKPKFKDVETILGSMYDQAWGNPDAAMQNKDEAEQDQARSSLKERIAAQQRATTEQMQEDRVPLAKDPEPEWASRPAEDAPKAEEPKVWTEEELRALPYDRIVVVAKEEGMDLPDDLEETTNAVVDWLLDQ